MITAQTYRLLGGRYTFPIIWFGQSVSALGSGLTAFGLGVWVFERSGSVTHFALIGLFAILPQILLSPFIGPMIDRWERRKVMILSDTGAGFSTLCIALLMMTGRLELWNIYLLVGIMAAFGTLQWPAYMSVIPNLVSENKLGRANGMVQTGKAIAEILSPAMAGALLLNTGLGSILVFDFSTYLIAMISLFLARFPDVTPAAAAPFGVVSWLQEILEGLVFTIQESGLAGLLAFSATVNFLWSMVAAVIAPMILGFTTSDQLGWIITIAGTGMLLGGVVMSIWGGPRPRIHGVLAFEMISGVCFLLIGWQPNFWPVALGVFGAHFTIAIVSGSTTAIWQSIVPKRLQGRVFATQQTVARAAAPLAYILAGPLVENIFDPLMTSQGVLSSVMGNVIGNGPGRGIGLLFLVMGGVKIAISIGGYLSPKVREVESGYPELILN